MRCARGKLKRAAVDISVRSYESVRGRRLRRLADRLHHSLGEREASLRLLTGGRVILVALLAAALAAMFAIPAAAKPPGTNGKIVTNSDNLLTGEEQVYTVDPDGTDQQLVGPNETGQWSWDGTRIAMFEGVFEFDSGILTSLNLDTQYPDMFLGCAQWSPDDTRIACEGFGLSDPSLNGIYTSPPP